MDLNSPELYLNRHLSHLQFNIRVLEQALDEKHPLLERLKFLLIFSHNLDEFFEIRVAGLRRQIQFLREVVDADGLHPQELLKQISSICHATVEKQYHILNDILIKALEVENINFLKRSDWTPKQATWIKRYFENQILPVISPIGLDPSHPFPRLVNKSLNFIVSLEGKDAFGRDSGLAIVPAPRSLPRLIRLPNEICASGDNFVFLSSMIHAHLDDLFPGMTTTGCYQFRITRNADVEIIEEEVKDLARAIKGELLARPYGDAVRLEIDDNCPDNLTQFLLEQFGLPIDALYRVNGPVNLGRLMALNDLLHRPDLCYPPFTPQIPKNLRSGASVFQAMQQNDILLLHPFQSFTPVVDLLKQAAKDPNVLSIRQTLYRTGADSEIVNALVEAARNRKEVTAIIEIRARFDEEDNLALASRLQEAGAVVVYGVVGYKTHCKMVLIVRREDNQLKMYTHLGTGNYHPRNARLYTDYSLLTCDSDICQDVYKIFQQLTGMGKISRVKKLLHAPFTLQKALIDLIQREEKHAENGLPAHIIVKVNALTDQKIIKALYKASQSGVKIDLIIRGMCCLRPQVVGVSENIRVRSIVGRFLEHSRVYYFFNNQQPETFCSSADWMERNTKRRVEVCFPILDTKLQQRIKRDLDFYLNDNCQSFELQADGTYLRNTPPSQSKEKAAQQLLLAAYSG